MGNNHGSDPADDTGTDDTTGGDLADATSSDVGGDTGDETSDATSSDTSAIPPAPDCPGGKYDELHKLCWQHPEADTRQTWPTANGYCDDLVLADSDQWRLPTRTEFIDMLGDCPPEVVNGGHGNCSSCKMSEFCNPMFGTELHYYWTSTPEEGQLDFYWGAGCADGLITTGQGPELQMYVRCVHAGP